MFFDINVVGWIFFCREVIEVISEVRFCYEFLYLKNYVEMFVRIIVYNKI